MKKENPVLKLHCVLPCEGQADGWSALTRERYFPILAQVDDIVYVRREYSKGCMLECNRYLVDHAACLMAVYNGSFRSGTGATVRYARKLNREIIVIDSDMCILTKLHQA